MIDEPRTIGVLAQYQEDETLFGFAKNALVKAIESTGGIPSNYDILDLDPCSFLRSVTLCGGILGKYPPSTITWDWGYDQEHIREFSGYVPNMMEASLNYNRFVVICGGYAGSDYTPSYLHHLRWNLLRNGHYATQWNVHSAHARGISRWRDRGGILLLKQSDRFTLNVDFLSQPKHRVICQLFGYVAELRGTTISTLTY